MSRYRPKEGWIELWRRIRDHRFWPTHTNRKFTKLEAWIDLMFDASYKAHRVKFRGHYYDLKEGELVFSQNDRATRWKWSRGAVRNYLDELYLNGEAKHEEAKGVTKLTILKKAGYIDWKPESLPENTETGKKGSKKGCKKGTSRPLSSNKGDVLTKGILAAWRNRKKKGSQE